MADWDVNLYLKFGKERTQPAIDLVNRIAHINPKRIIDLGCGSGNSTQVLKAKWGDAEITGLDSSHEMISTAQKKYPDLKWIQGDISAWQDPSFDLIFSNAAFHWVPNHLELLSRLISQLNVGGVLAFQVPYHKNSELHQLIHQIASEPHWGDQFATAKKAITIESPGFYYDILCDKTVRVDIWKTEYIHEMDDHQAIIDWISATGLRPYLDAMQRKNDKDLFIKRLEFGLRDIYPFQKNKKILFPFQRLFLIGYR